jgi:circadian clock protein KaiB
MIPTVNGVRLLLFTSQSSPHSVMAVSNVKRALAGFDDGIFVLEIVNVADDPERALMERVMVTPTLLAPDSARRIVGNLSEETQLDYFLRGLAPASR